MRPIGSIEPADKPDVNSVASFGSFFANAPSPQIGGSFENSDRRDEDTNTVVNELILNRNQLSRNGGHSGVDSYRVIGRSRSSGSMTSQSFFQKPAGVSSPMGSSRPSNQASNSKSYKTA